MCNYFFLLFKKKTIQATITIIWDGECLFPDRIINLYSIKVTWKQKEKHERILVSCLKKGLLKRYLRDKN